MAPLPLPTVGPPSAAFAAAYRRSLDDPEGFWGELAADVHWYRPYTKVLDRSRAPFYRWFPGGLFNTCYNAVDRHIDAGKGEKVALIYDSPLASTQQKLTYAQLQHAVARFAGALCRRGVKAGDCVLVYLPMVPEAVIAILACARIGAIHSVVFGGFAAPELANRINAATPIALITASCGHLGPGRSQAYKPIVDAALALATNAPAFTVVLQRDPVVASLGPRDVEWGNFVAGAPWVDCLPLDSTAPLYVLYTSGTTGDPQGILRDAAGHCVALRWTMDAIYGVTDDSVFWAASDIGWVVGHSYIIYGPLFRGLTTVMYDGKPVGTPDAGAFWRMIAEHKVTHLFTAPTAFRSIGKEDPTCALLQRHNIRTLQAVYLAGERSDPGTIRWIQEALERKLGVRHPLVFDHYWQTETGWTIAGPCPGLVGGHAAVRVKPGSCNRPVPGYMVQLMAEDCETPHPAPRTDGAETYPIALMLPLPPGSFPTLYKNDRRFVGAYLTADGKYYRTGDAGYVDEDGFLYVMTRTDDVVNVAGHRLATGAMEEILASHPSVAECAVFGIPDPLKGHVPVGCVVLKDGVDPIAVPREAVALVRGRIGAIACFSRCFVVPKLPKTRSGKILRKELAKMAAGSPYQVPPTIDDPSVLPVLEAILRPTAPAKL